jgi:hypothetical protein
MPKKVPNTQRIINNVILKIVNIVFTDCGGGGRGGGGAVARTKNKMASRFVPVYRRTNLCTKKATKKYLALCRGIL